MNPNEQQPLQSRASEVWRRMVGMFGGDAVERKFGPKPPPEWVAMLTRLNDQQIDRGIRRLAYSGKPHVPTLPEFTKLCRAVGGDEIDEGDRPQRALPKPEAVDWNPWDVAANRHLLGHIIARLKEKSQVYGRPASYKLLTAPIEDLRKIGIDEKLLDASGEFVINVRKLVAAKNAWAADMKDLDHGDGVPDATQKAVWNDYISRAEKGLS